VSAFIKENTVFQDIGGEPLVNGLLYIGANGSDPVTTAPSTTIFSDRELTIPLANPQTLDDFGQSTNKIWIDGKYSLQVNNSNGVQKFQDLDAGETTESGITALSNVQGTNTITAEAATTITAYVDKEIYVFTVETTNTDPVTLNIDGVGALAVVKNINDPLADGDLVANQVALVVFNASSTDFSVINQADKDPVLTGTITTWPVAAIPSGYLVCNDTAVSRTDFSDLFALLGVTYGDGDGSTTFNVPDLRGEFIRGFDNSAGNDPDAGSRTDRGDGATGDSVGTKQLDEFESHAHGIDQIINNSASGTETNTVIAFASTDILTSSEGGAETRPRNVYMIYIIKT